MFRPRGKRIKVAIPIIVTTAQLAPVYLQRNVMGITQNISLNGLGIKFREQHGFTGGERVYVTLKHPLKRKRRTILAQIVWIKGLSAGLKFIKVFQDQQTEIHPVNDKDALPTPYMMTKSKVGKMYTGHG
jgi:hypothetical protein